MRAAALATTLALTLAASPAFAQLSGGVGSSNAANQSFQQQNAMRGLQQQQNFNNQTTGMQIQRNNFYRNTGSSGAYLRRHR